MFIRRALRASCTNCGWILELAGKNNKKKRMILKQLKNVYIPLKAKHIKVCALFHKNM